MSILKRSGEAARSLAYGGAKWVERTLVICPWSVRSKPSAQKDKAPRTFFPYRVPEWDNRPCWRRRRQCQSWVSRADPKFIITGFGRSFKQLRLASTFCPLGANLFLKNEDLTLCLKAFFLSLKIFLTFFDGVG